MLDNNVILRRALDMISAVNTLTLPMDVQRIAQHFDYYVQYYSRSVDLLDALGVTENAQGRRAICTRYQGRYYIFLSDDLDAEQERFCIAHEMGHIVLGHLDPDRTPPEKEEAEDQANRFACTLLAPPPVLEHYCIECPENLHRRTGLSLAHSRTAYRLLEEYRRAQAEAARWEFVSRQAEAVIRQQAQIPSRCSVPSDHAPHSTATLIPFRKVVG